MCMGSFKAYVRVLLNKAGLNFDNYVFHVGKRLRMGLPNQKEEFLDLDGLVTYNKKQWESDLLAGVTVEYGVNCDKKTFPVEKYDFILDCTGFHRKFLPKPQEDFVIPAYEYLVENIQDIDEFQVIGYKGARGTFGTFL